MKIIDNKKDYYDYLMGIYGQDTQVVYDRRNSQIPDIGIYEREYPDWKTGNPNLKYHIWIGNEGYIITYQNDNWTCVKEIGKGWYAEKPYPRKTDKPIELIIANKSNRWVNNCIIFRSGNPILKELKIITRFFTPDFIWNTIYNYICSQKEKPIVDTRTDVQKAESHGFDKKTSFRK